MSARTCAESSVNPKYGAVSRLVYTDFSETQSTDAIPAVDLASFRICTTSS